MSFETVMLPHLDAAYSLASYLLRDPSDAEDVTQQACLRALAYFPTYRGDNPRAWLLAIVRNAVHDWRAREQRSVREESFDETLHGDAIASDSADSALIQSAARDEVRHALATLPHELREVIVLRELEELSYRDIAAVIGVPIGTVMSRLSRARTRLAITLGATRSL